MPDDVEWIDLGLARILRNVQFLDQSVVRVGVVGKAADRPSADGRLTMGEVALINEYGSRAVRIPPRSFIRSALHTPLATQLAERIANAALTFGDVDAELARAGERLAEVMRDAILHGELTPNAEATIRKKGFDQPLIDSSGLLDAIGHQIVRGRGALSDVDDAIGELEALQVASVEE